MLSLFMFRIGQPVPPPRLPHKSVRLLSLFSPVQQCDARPHLRKSFSPLPSPASLLPDTTFLSQITNSFRMRTFEKHAFNFFGMRTFKTKGLKPFRMNTFEKIRGGALRISSKLPHRLCHQMGVG